MKKTVFDNRLQDIFPNRTPEQYDEIIAAFCGYAEVVVSILQRYESERQEQGRTEPAV